jgi:hypothetical protein
MCAGAVVLAGLGASAGPLRRADVAVDPVWLVHVDCDGMRPTAIGRYVQAEMEKPATQAKLAAFQALFSFDLRTQLHGLTLYGTGSAPEDGVLLVYADFEPSRLVTLAQAASDAREITYKQHTIYSWNDQHRKKKPGADGAKARTYAAISGRCVIFGQREARVAQALDVLTGNSANLGSGKVFSQLGAVGNTSFIEAAARKMDFLPADPNAAILRLSRQVRFQLSEAQQQLSAVLTFEANDEEVAANMASIAQGLVALMKLQKEKPESVKVAEALTLKQEGSSLVVNLRLPANDVVQMIKADAARKAQKKAAKEREQ